MKTSLTQLLVNSTKGFGVFLLGFILGTIIDIIFFKIYSKWDPTDKNNSKLMTISLFQIYFIIILLEIISLYKKPGDTFSIGLMTSQIFLFVHSAEHISGMIYDRKVA